MSLETIIQENRPSRKELERETGIEPATSSLGSWHSTTELLPPESDSPNSNRLFFAVGRRNARGGFSRSRFQRSEISYLSWKIGVGSRRAQFSLLADAGTRFQQT